MIIFLLTLIIQIHWKKVYDIVNNNILYIHGRALSNERLIIGHHNVFAYAGKQPLLLTYEEMD